MPEAEFITSELESFVTVSEAARALGVDARQIRRWTDRLSESDKSSDTVRKYRGVPIVTVRLSALKALQEGQSEEFVEGNSTNRDSDIGTGQQFGKNDRPVLMSELGSNLREIIERQDREIVRLSEALSASQQIASQAQQLQLLAERRLAEVEGKALPAKEQDRPLETPRADSSGGSAPDGSETPGTGKRPGEASKLRPFWAFWRRSGQKG